MPSRFWHRRLTGKKSKLPDEDSQEIKSWEARKVRIWKAQGRLAEDGTLRLSSKPLRRHYAKSFKRAFPSLSLRNCQELAAILYGDNRYRRRVGHAKLPEKFGARLVY